MVINEPCVMCEEKPESVFHLLFECQEVQNVWGTTRFDFSSWTYHNSLLEWMTVEWDRWGREKKCVFWDEACVAGNGAPLDVEIPSELKREKPKAPYLKLNVDAAVRSSGEGALGGLFRDSERVVHGAFMASAPALNDSTLVEALAIKKGVEVAHQMEVLDLVVESDSRLVIDMLNSNCNHISLLCSICVSILDICLGFNDVYFKWIPRACNMCADKICKAARHVTGEQIWQDSLPICIIDACTEDFH
ncbi:uncharacterized protein G2W53_031801 [Senna tora]|uniref:RNase H type-1 domain-containing protein n=1 Tax=Senna tora TaxID=362788 RepID=A0A834SXP1_9FABA|nr:uncharacterized protein G2W53_031801 [Senna tora]